MLDNIKLSKEILDELATVVSDFITSDNKTISINPLSPEKLSVQINQDVSKMRTMTYNKESVTGCEAIVKSFTNKFVEYFKNNYQLTDVNDTKFTNLKNGEVLTYEDGVWINREINQIISKTENNTYTTENSVNIGTGTTNNLVKFSNQYGRISDSSISENLTSVSTNLNLLIGSQLDIIPKIDNEYSLTRYFPFGSVYSTQPMFAIGQFKSSNGNFQIRRNIDEANYLNPDLSIDYNGNVQIGNSLNVVGTLMRNNYTVWDSGNLSPNQISLSAFSHGYVTPEMFGGAADWDWPTQTGTDNTAAINAAAEYAYQNKKSVLFTGNHYLVKGIIYTAVPFEGITKGIIIPSDFWGSTYYNYHAEVPYYLTTEGTCLVWDKSTLSITDTYIQPRPKTHTNQDYVDVVTPTFKNLKFMSMSNNGQGGGILMRVGYQSQEQYPTNPYGFTNRDLLNNCSFANFSMAILIDQQYSSDFKDLWFRGCRTAFSIGGYGGSTTNSFSNIEVEACGGYFNNIMYPSIDLRVTYGVTITNLNTQASAFIGIGHCNGATEINGKWYFESQKSSYVNWYGHDTNMIKYAATTDYGLDKRVSLVIRNGNGPVGSSGDFDFSGLDAGSILLSDSYMSSTIVYGNPNLAFTKQGSVSVAAVRGFVMQGEFSVGGQLKTGSMGDEYSPGAIFGTSDRQGIQFYRRSLNDSTIIKLNNLSKNPTMINVTVPTNIPDIDTLITTVFQTAKGSAVGYYDVFCTLGTNDTNDNYLASVKGSALSAFDIWKVMHVPPNTPHYILSYGDPGNNLRLILAGGSSESQIDASSIDLRGINYPTSDGYSKESPGGEGPDLCFFASAFGKMRYQTNYALHEFIGGPLTLVGASRVYKQTVDLLSIAVPSPSLKRKTINIGSSGVLVAHPYQFVKGGDLSLSYSYQAPYDHDESTNLVMYIEWLPGTGWDAGTRVEWNHSFLIKSHGDDFTTSTPSLNGFASLPSGANTTTIQQLDIISNLKQGQVIRGLLYRDSDSNDDTTNADGLLLRMWFEYTQCRLGRRYW